MGLSWSSTEFFASSRVECEPGIRNQRRRQWEVIVRRTSNRIAFGYLANAYVGDDPDAAFFVESFRDEDVERMADEIMSEMRDFFEHEENLVREVQKILSEEDVLVMGPKDFETAMSRRQVFESRRIVMDSKYLHSFKVFESHVEMGCKLCCSCDEMIKVAMENLCHIRAHEEAHESGGVVCVHCFDDSITERIIDVGPSWGKHRWGGLRKTEYRRRGGFFSETKFDVHKIRAQVCQNEMVCSGCGYVKKGSVWKNPSPWKIIADFEKHRKACAIFMSLNDSEDG